MQSRFREQGSKKVCDTVSQSKEGERMALTIMRGHLLPPVRAEPVVGRKQPIAQ